MLAGGCLYVPGDCSSFSKPCSPRTDFLPLSLTTVLFLTFLWYDFFFKYKSLLVFLTDLLLQDFDISSLPYYCNNNNLGPLYEVQILLQGPHGLVAPNAHSYYLGTSKKAPHIFKNMYFKHLFPSDSWSYGKFHSVPIVLFSETPSLSLTFAHFNSNGVSFLLFLSPLFFFSSSSYKRNQSSCHQKVVSAEWASPSHSS